MAGQSNAPDDLIAELARLMADDARPEQSKREATPSVRIPGVEPVRPVAQPSVNLAAPAEPQMRREPTLAATPFVRVPGTGDASERRPPAAPATPDPFNFDFDLGVDRKPSGPASALPVTPAPRPAVDTANMFRQVEPVVTRPQPAPVAPPAPPPETHVQPQPVPVDDAQLDQDGLADLIAAELANDFQPAAQNHAASEPRGDNFGVPPVFGLTGPVEVPEPEPEPAEIIPEEPIVPVAPVAAEIRPAPPVENRAPVEASDGNDPLDEIERLVGPAVRLSQPAPSPALRSLATPTLPSQPAPPPRNRPAPTSGSVDDAILAAAAATGARIEWVDPGEGSEAADDVAPMARQRRARGRGVSKAVIGPLVAIGLLAVAGVGLYWVLGQGGAPAGPAPLIAADPTPIKEVPAADTTAAAQQSVVFNEISGNNTGADEQIVSRDQADDTAVADASAAVGSSGTLTTGEQGSVDPNQDGLVNRKVRTVTVRPDGTIVSGDDSVAGASILPVDRPNVPDVPGANFATPDLIANAGTAATEPAATEQTPAVAATPTPTVNPVTAGSVVPVADAAGALVSGRTVTIPMQRPSDFAQAASAALSAASTPTTAAPAAATATTPAATTDAAATAAAPAAGSAAAYAQLSSQRTEEAARQSAQSIATRYGVVFGGASLEIQRVDLGERGIYYRVLVPAASRDAAGNICVNVKAAGGDCFVL